MTILLMAKLFFLSLGYSVFAFAPVAKSELTGGGFQKLLTTVSLVSLFFAQICHIIMGGSSIDIASWMLYISMISMLFHRQLHHTIDKKNITLWILYLVPTLLAIPYFYLFQSNLKAYLFILSSGYYLGSITYAMILGHWYLVTPKLTERPLNKALIIMWILFLPKIVWSGYEAYQASDYFTAGTMLGGGYAFNWLMLIMRSIWGYLIIFAMSIFGWKLVCMRSIQSATGIFYAMTIFAFIGEVISGYLFFKFGLPI